MEGIVAAPVKHPNTKKEIKEKMTVYGVVKTVRWKTDNLRTKMEKQESRELKPKRTKTSNSS